LSKAILKNESAQVSFSGITIATFLPWCVKHALPHFFSSTSPHPRAVTLNARVSFSHFFAYGTCIA
jgi:hypothetical protein